MAAARGFRRAHFSSDAAAAAAAAAASNQGPGPDSKRPKSLLKAAITRLGGPSQTAEETAQAALDVQRQQQQDQRAQTLQQLQQRLQQQRSVVEAAGSSWQQPSAAPLSAAAATSDDDILLHLNSDDSQVGGEDAHGNLESVEAAGAAKQQRHVQAQAQAQQAPVVVPACGPECTHTHSNGWCHSQVGAVGT
jgi:hypothetical protein